MGTHYHGANESGSMAKQIIRPQMRYANQGRSRLLLDTHLDLLSHLRNLRLMIAHPLTRLVLVCFAMLALILVDGCSKSFERGRGKITMSVLPQALGLFARFLFP